VFVVTDLLKSEGRQEIDTSNSLLLFIVAFAVNGYIKESCS
jgi:hypothetical protein